PMANFTPSGLHAVAVTKKDALLENILNVPTAAAGGDQIFWILDIIRTHMCNQAGRRLHLVSVMLLILLTAASISAQGTLRDDLSDENCPAACFLGIMPGITSKSELETILNAHGIQFDAAPLGSGNIINYLFNPDISSGFIASEPNSVSI